MKRLFLLAGCVGVLHASTPFDIALSQYSNIDLYVTGKSIHGPSHPHRDRLNERNYGIGIGVSTPEQDGETNHMYVMHFQDSFKKGQTMVGYTQLHMTALPYTQLGYTVGVMHKPSRLHVPVPYIMPVLQIGTNNSHLMLTGLPKIPKVNDTQLGDILFIFARQTF